MHVIVIGGGIIGVTTAYFLRQAGCDVTLVEKRDGVAQETSFANSGIIAPAYTTPWAAPGMPRKLIGYAFRQYSPLIFKPTLDPAVWRWIAAWIGQCRLERYRINKLRMQRVAMHSRAVLDTLRKKLGLNYEQSTGYLQLFRTEREVALTKPALELLRETGIPFSLVDEAGARIIEPGIAEDFRFAGAIHLPQDESGNCALFARLLRKQAEADSINFRFGHHVSRIEAVDSHVDVHTNHGVIRADNLVLAAGVASAELAKPLRIRIPLWPVKGYSATAQVVAGESAPRAALMDEAYKVGITRLGTRIRVAGIAELSNSTLAIREAAVKTLIKVARDWFPHAANYSTASYWCGARPMLPDGAPLLGPTPYKRVFLNVGHGSTGWAMSCGCAQVVADVITGKPAEVDLDGLTLARYG
jgi:D-amino-acid dehydrogenase